MNPRSHAPPHRPPKAEAPSPELLASIEHVRQQLPVATDFAKLYQCYDDHVARRDDLWASSEHGGFERLVTLVTASATSVRPGFVPLVTSCFEVKDSGFWHGMVFGVDALGCFFFDERVGQGLMALSNPFDNTSVTAFVRFTRVMLDATNERMPN